MRTTGIAYIATMLVLLGTDFVWLTLSINSVYKPHLDGLLMAKPNFQIGLLFYLLYAASLVVFAVMPAVQQGDGVRALWSGALLGFTAYAAYDLTNLATLKNWSVFVSIIDMAWGTTLSAIAATAGYFITRIVAP